MKPTLPQPLCPSAGAQTWEGDNQTPPWVELQPGFKSQETEMSSSFYTLSLHFSLALHHPTAFWSRKFLAPVRLSHLPPLLQGFLHHKMAWRGWWPHPSVNIQSPETRPGLPHLLASSDLLSRSPQLQRKSLALAILQWLLPLTDTPPHPSFSPLPRAAPWLQSMLSSGFTPNLRLQCQLWYSNQQSSGSHAKTILPALISSADAKGTGPQALPCTSNISSGESCGETPAQKSPFFPRSCSIFTLGWDKAF